eukprot:CAMPEP_0185619694 /NCGR_PEP_ID=MMETSP0436-20130131/51434_1 /TAXON_ID=626734 ORGANISM="Favella taraikaensis, Strain Fe Narragansett Bay" /NCGR_SAMPLE_ID=MMETSP0436 /ASSEMBLY_ACC=CAM_ASM_000390 /LENGTH=32 /DNA_ID= /DNA_START= /DNA_END= /DNA_ORIENTATION=
MARSLNVEDISDESELRQKHTRLKANSQISHA